MKLQFSGHESFICKHFWLKKGYDYIQSKGNFNDESAVVELGVGKNMVISISYWLKAFGIVDANNTITELGNFIFNDKRGVDPYVESLTTIWLLHYSLIKTSKASIYNLFFNEFRRQRPTFTKDQFLNFLKRKMEEEGQKNFTENTLNADFSVFMRNYLQSSNKVVKIDVEEDFSNLMIDLSLIKSYKLKNADQAIVDWYEIENKFQVDLPADLVLFSILDNDTYSKSISFRDLLVEKNSPGTIFVLNDEGLFNKLQEIVKKHKGITFTDSAGVRELQFKGTFQKWEILHGYYKD